MIEEDKIIEGLTVDNASERASKWLEANADLLAYPGGFNGRGIVTCAGGPRYTIPAYVLVKSLRHTGCTLPIELWYRGKDEFMPEFARLMKPLDVTWIDAYGVREQHPHARLNGFELKPYSVQWSKFAEVIFLDADNFVIHDPAFLFDDPHYVEAGSVFWPDYYKTPKTDPIWKVYGVPFHDTHRPETGQIVIDKRRCWPGLTLADYASQRSKFYFLFGYGDLGTFQFGWLRTGCGYSMIPHGIKSLRHSGHHRTMCQHDFSGRRIFQHHNTSKWRLDYWEDVPGFEGLDLVRGWLDELRAYWSPASSEFATEADIEAAKKLVGRVYDYRRMAGCCGGKVKDSRKLELGANGLIGRGAAKCERYWCVRGGRLMIAQGDGKQIMDLEPTAFGWKGAWKLHERMPVELRT